MPVDQARHLHGRVHGRQPVGDARVHLRPAHPHLEQRRAARDGVDRLPLAHDPARLAEQRRVAGEATGLGEPLAAEARAGLLVGRQHERHARPASRPPSSSAAAANTIAATAPFMSPEPTPWSSPSSTAPPYGSRRHSSRSPGGFVSRWPPRISVRPLAPPTCASRFGRSAARADRLDPGDAELAQLLDDQRRDRALVAGRVRARRRDELARELDELVAARAQVLDERRVAAAASCRERLDRRARSAPCPRRATSASTANEMRTRPSPPGPNTSPGATATRSSSSSAQRELARREARRRDVDEHVEGALRPEDVEPVLGGRLDRPVAPLAVGVAHRVELVARPAQHRRRGVLRDRRRARDLRLLELAQHVRELRRRGAVAEPPAGHRVDLREAVDRDDRRLGHERGGGHVRAARRG